MPRTPRIHPLPSAIAATAITLAGVVAAPSASADSIAYVKDGNVWLSTPDASRQYQVTFDGGYSTASQSDHDRIAALRGDRIVTLSRSGQTIHVDGSTRYDILTPHSYTMPGTMFRGPFDPAISPDGMKIAYSWYYTQIGQTPNCNPSTGCQTVYGRQGTNYISPDGKSPFDQPGWTERTGWVGPSWTQDGETIVSDPIQVGNEDAIVSWPGDATNGLKGGFGRWFFDPSAQGGLSDGEQSRDKKKLAFVTGDQHEKIYLYRAMGGYPNVPYNCFALTGVGRLSSPSWSPDGTTLAFADDRGISVIRTPDATDGCGDPSGSESRLLIPGATNPDWGPADVPPARPAPPSDDGGAGTPLTGGGTTPTPGGGAAPRPGSQAPGGQPGPVVMDPARDVTTVPNGPAITVRATPRLRRALTGGLKVQLSGLKPGKVAVTAKAAGKTVATGRGRVGQRGRATITLRFTKSAKRSLRAKKKVRFALTAGSVASVITLRR